MNRFQRLVALLLAMMLVLPMVPASVFAMTDETETSVTEQNVSEDEVYADTFVTESEVTQIFGQIPVQVNPLYAEAFSSEKVVRSAAPIMQLSEPEYGTVADAVPVLREGLKIRAPQVTVYVKTTADEYEQVFYDILDNAMLHTGNPTEGDYLKYQYAAYGGSYGGHIDSQGNYCISYQYDFVYHDSAEQQDAMDAAVNALLEQLNLYGKSDYEKVCGIYDWMCANITYDYDNLDDENYRLKYTAYAALVNRTAVCQGYANLFYRLALALGVDNRIISGTGITNTGSGPHAWNIVKLNGSYYDLDATWDASWKQAGRAYDWFLRSETNFSADHVRDSQYTTAAFQAAYPMAVKDYDPLDYILASGTCGDNLTWELDTDGTLTVSGEGEMQDYSTANPAPWSQFSDDIFGVILEEGTASIGDYAFHGCRSMTSIQLPMTMASIGAYAFYSCNALEEVTVPANVTDIDSRAFAWCTGLTEITFEGDAPTIASNSFYFVTATAHYPAAKTTWTEEVLQNYGGGITWMADCADGHAEVIDEAVEATCTESGLTEGKHCSACGKILVAQEVIPAGHDFVDGVCRYCGIITGTCGENLTWTLDSNGTLTISGSGPMTDYEYSKGAPWNKSVKTVIIEEGVTSIGTHAFYSCSKLTDVTIPDSVTSIGNYAFYSCSGLTDVTIPDSVTSIGEYAFNECSSLTSAVIGNSVISIGDSAFQGCGSLASVIMGDSVESIGWYAFVDCTSLTSLRIPGTVSNIGANAFTRCTSLTEFVVDESSEHYSSDQHGVLFNKDKTALAFCPAGKTGEYAIPDSVTHIMESAFGYCAGLTRVTLPDSVINIKDRAFEYCTALTDVNIPNSVVSIGWAAFADCVGLTDVTIPDSVTHLGIAAFSSCSGLTNVTIGNSVESINDGTFRSCTSLTDVTIGNSVAGIGQYAFSECTALTSVTIPKPVTSIGHHAFYRCPSLSSVTIPDSVTRIGYYAFAHCGLTGVRLPDALTCIEDAVFSDCDKLTAVTIPDSVTDIKEYAFEKCSSLTNVKIGDSVTGIGNYAFLECSSLTDVTIGDSVTDIGKYAFSECSSLTDVTVGNSVTSVGRGAFSSCRALKKIVFEGNAPTIAEWTFANITTTAYYPAGNETWTSDVMQDYSGSVTWVPYETAEAIVGGVRYDTLAEALAAAKSGDTVTLTKDTVGTGNAIVRTGVILDLNGYTLTADYVFAVNGANVVDNSVENTGLLKVDANRVMISKSNSQLPVWNGEGYVFTTVTYRTRLVSHDNDSLKFAFLPQFKSGATALLEDGVKGNKVTIEVRVSWTTTMGQEYRNLVFNEDQVDMVVGTNGAFLLTFSGFSQLDMASGISVEGIVISETGVSIASKAIVV